MDGEEVCTRVVHTADDEVCTNVALVSVRLLALREEKEEGDLPVEVLFQHGHGRHDLRLPPARQRMQLRRTA